MLLRKISGCLIKILLVILLIIAVFNYKEILKYFYPIDYEEIIETYSEQYDLDPLLVAAIIKTESNFDPSAQSASGAMGLMQIMPDTAQWIAKKMEMDNFFNEALYQPSINVSMGCWYIDYLQQQFDDDIALVLAAYNGGLGNVKQWLDEGVWDGTAENVAQIPYTETRQYVSKILSNYKIYKTLYQ